MKNLFAFLAVLLPFVCLPAHAIVQDVGGSQGDFEREVHAVVRNKRFYKAGKIELSVDGGLMPYDSVYNDYQFGGRLAWHLSDHWSWEILDAQVVASSVSSFTTSTITAQAAQGNPIADMESVMPKMFLGSNLLISPIYGKIRFFGAQVLYFDIYTVAGIGLAKTETHQFSANGTSGVNDVVVKSGMDPMGTLGLGFKIFMGNRFGFLIDLRDYLGDSTTYGSKSIKNNFVVTFGLSFFLPSFG